MKLKLTYTKQNLQDEEEKIQAQKQLNDKELIKKLEDFEIDEENEDRANYDNLVDILFVVDTTGSMGWCIEESKKTIIHIIENFTKQEFNLKFALECYRDHPPQENSYLEQHTDLTNAKDIFIKLQTINAQGGGDEPEAVMDGLKAGLEKTSWRKTEDNLSQSKRFLFHICDAPPHGIEYGCHSIDQKWEQNGCPCGITRDQIAKLLNLLDVNYYLVKCGDKLNKMEEIFKDCFKEKFGETICVQNTSTTTKTVERKSLIKSINPEEIDIATSTEVSKECEKHSFHKEIVQTISKKLK